MRPLRLLIPMVFCYLALIGSAAAQDPQDVEGGKDTPYFTRMPNFFIDETAERDFDAYTFFDGKKEVSVEGKVYQTKYRRKDDAPPVSILQVRRNYVNAIKSLGAQLLFEGVHEAFEDTRSGAVIITALLTRGGNQAWIEIWPQTDDEYTLTVVERESMKQEISASDMLKALNKDGFIALDIHFDTGKATIKSESRPIIDQVIELLKANAALKLSIEGHTDNVGDPKSNKTLSEVRAASMAAALTHAGIARSRLAAVGYGQERPVADNRTEEGRAKNRRVELVKK